MLEGNPKYSKKKWLNLLITGRFSIEGNTGFQKLQKFGVEEALISPCILYNIFNSFKPASHKKG